jgi:predicted ATP-binding protein involved in virulence
MFIEKIIIKEILNLRDIEIDLGKEKKHLILTGKNGCGKTTVLRFINDFFESEIRNTVSEKIINGIDIFFNQNKEIKNFYSKYFIFYFFEAKRKSDIKPSNGVEKLNLNSINKSRTNQNFLKYLVHLKTQQAYAYLNKNDEKLEKINTWFNRFEETIQEIFETKDIKLIYDEDKYNFKLKEPDKEFDFTTLSDGYSAILDIVTELMLRMEKDETYKYEYNLHGIVLIDEIETHLHINLQKKIMKILTKMFPNIQFIVTTHSPFILNSLDNAVVFDLEKKLRVENLDLYSYDRLVETYFNNDKYNSELVTKLNRYEKLALSDSKTEEEIKEEIELRNELSQITYDMAKEANLKFREIELKRGFLDV